MLINLITFGGVIFWALFALYVIFMLSYVETEDAESAVMCTLIAIGLCFAFTKVPEINFVKWGLSYLGIGLVTWFSIFNYKILKLKNFMRANSITSRDMLREKSEYSYYNNIYRNEPSFESFFSRVLIWPLVIVKLVFSDLLYDIVSKSYVVVREWAIGYKDRMLGLK